MKIFLSCLLAFVALQNTNAQSPATAVKNGFYQREGEGGKLIYSFYRNDTLLYDHLTKLEEVYCIDGDCASGQGKLLMADGSLYEGEVQGGKATGKGKLTFTNAVYVGEFLANKTHGRGKMTWNDGGIHEGEYRDGQRNGYGVFRFADGAVYTGSFKNNFLDGEGTYVWGNGGYYKGSWVKGVKEGFGKMLYKDSSVYEGAWMNDQSHGRGSFTWGSGQWKGDKLVGEWRSGKANGRGSYYFTNGNRYEGVFVDDRYEGEGVYTFSNGDKYISNEWKGFGFSNGKHVKASSSDTAFGSMANNLFTATNRLRNLRQNTVEIITPTVAYAKAFDAATSAWIEACTKAINAGNADSLWALGSFYLQYTDLHPQGINLFRKHQTLPCANCSYELAYSFEVWKPSASAAIIDTTVYHFLKAAKAGHVDAMHNIAIVYDLYKNDKAAARYWYKQAADGGSPEAKKYYAEFIDADNDPVGKGMIAYNAKDYAEALRLFYLADKINKDNKAQYMIGTMYFYGQGKPRDYDRAKAWFEDAGSNGNGRGSFAAANIWATDGPDSSWTNWRENAKLWYQKALNQGVSEAQVGLDRINRSIAAAQQSKTSGTGVNYGAPTYNRSATSSNTSSSTATAPAKKWCYDCKGTGQIATIEYYQSSSDRRSGLQSGRTVYKTCGRCYGKGSY